MGRPPDFVRERQCFRKVAENAAVCLRRGDPVVVRGTLRVREFGPDDGPKRQSVEVIAESLGHDLSRGISVFNKHSGHQEMTADELERSMAGDAQGPLPGDGPAAESDAAVDEDGSSSDLRADSSPGAEPGAEDDGFDEEEAQRMLASSELAEPAGASL